jgi:uncharacterized protein (DUF2336 family)
MDENDMYNVNLRGRLDQALAHDKDNLKQYIDTVREALKDDDLVAVWARTGNNMRENVVKNSTSTDELVVLLVTAIVQLAQIEEEE